MSATPKKKGGRVVAAAPGTRALAVAMSLDPDSDKLVIKTFEAPIVAWEIVGSRPYPVIVGELKLEYIGFRVEYGLIVSDDSIMEMSGCCHEPFTRDEFVEFVSEDMLEELRTQQAEFVERRKIMQGNIPDLFPDGGEV